MSCCPDQKGKREAISLRGRDDVDGDSTKAGMTRNRENEKAREGKEEKTH